MKIKVIGSTKVGYAMPKEDAVDFSGKSAGICYLPDTVETLFSELPEKTQKRAIGNIKSGHHSVFGHPTYNLCLEGIPKILAMFLNNEKMYNTSEKSARYTHMEPSPQEKELYEKWIEIYKEQIKLKYPDFDKKIAQNIDELNENEQQENNTLKESSIIDSTNENIIPENNTTTEDTPSEPAEYGPPTFSWVSASSTLKDYPVKNTTDKDLRTTWLEGVKGNGINEWIMYSSENNQKVSSITLYNGYLKNDKVYLNNGRIKKLSIEFSDGEVITRDLEKFSFSEAKKGYVITLEEPKITTSLKLTILDAYQGSYYTDTGFSEIEFN